jgi:chondroitin AC lyase
MKKGLHSVLFLMISLISTSTLAHKIGEPYQGGIIFWIDEKGEHGLIAALEDEKDGDGKRYYGMSLVGQLNHVGDNIVIDADHDGILAGKYNTNRIIEAYGVPTMGDPSAAWIAATSREGGYGDWYLPSKYELDLLGKQRNIVGGFRCAQYWSSTTVKNDLKGIWIQYFCKNYPNDLSQFTIFRHSVTPMVRRIRAF